MNSKNSETSNPHRLTFNHSEKLDFSNKHIALSKRSIY